MNKTTTHDRLIEIPHDGRVRIMAPVFFGPIPEKLIEHIEQCSPMTAAGDEFETTFNADYGFFDAFGFIKGKEDGMVAVINAILRNYKELPCSQSDMDIYSRLISFPFETRKFVQWDSMPVLSGHFERMCWLLAASTVEHLIINREIEYDLLSD